jgi:hypothetical protein
MKITIVRVAILPPAVPSPSVRTERCETSDGELHTGPGGLYKAARHLISTGVSPKARMRVTRDGKVVLSGTVDAFARRTWGGDTRDPDSRPWVPYPGDVLPPALAAWWQGVAPPRP